MKNFDSLVDIWQAQNSKPDIDYKTVITQVNKSKNKLILKLFWGLIAMAIALVTILFLWLKTPFSYTTTHISLLVFVICCVYYMVLQIKNLTLLSKNNLTETPKFYIEKIQKFKQLRYKENTRNYFFYTLAIGVGFILYFIEFFSQVNAWVIAVSLMFIILWFLGSYMYILKIYRKREEKAINQMLQDLERIKNQFD
ncbi:MAG: hypothetical protein EAZ51_07070 [Sphingobacteriales bacterium]|nr:MAG: hypothetical protein EAZ64_00935 [Sphingobacteriales bacterium]TAF79850.1 MAG: hypothetical protein EAZ51_07070 [Sphingobacteriales bacterium]